MYAAAAAPRYEVGRFVAPSNQQGRQDQVRSHGWPQQHAAHAARDADMGENKVTAALAMPL